MSVSFDAVGPSSSGATSLAVINDPTGAGEGKVCQIRYQGTANQDGVIDSNRMLSWFVNGDHPRIGP